MGGGGPANREKVWKGKFLEGEKWKGGREMGKGGEGKVWKGEMGGGFSTNRDKEKE